MGTAIDLVRCGELAAGDFLGAGRPATCPASRTSAIVEAVLRWTLRHARSPRHLAPAEVADAVAQVAAACETGLASRAATPSWRWR